MTSKQIAACGVFGAATFALAFVLGSGVILATGIPATGGLLNIFVCVAVAVVGAHSVPKVGSATIMMLVTFTLGIPTVIGGPPGIYKPLIGLAIGLTYDVIVALGGRRQWAVYVGGGAAAMTSILTIFEAMILLGLPGVEKLRPILLPLAGAQFVLGFAGAALGRWLYESKLSRLRVFVSLREDEDEPKRHDS
jgi:hypothetical protein